MQEDLSHHVEIHGSKNVFADKDKTVVSSSWKDLACHCPAPTDTAPTLHVNDKHLKSIQMDAGAVDPAVHNVFAEHQDAEWRL